MNSILMHPPFNKIFPYVPELIFYCIGICNIYMISFIPSLIDDIPKLNFIEVEL